MSPAPPASDLVEALNQRFAAIAGWSFDHRWIVLGLSIAATLGALVLAGNVQLDNTYEAYFNESDTTYRLYEQYRDDFGSDEVSYVLYDAPDHEHGPWNLEVMRKIRHLTSTLEDEVPFIYEVQSLVNAELIEGVPGGIDIAELDDDFPESQARLLELRERYLVKPSLVGGLVSADGEHGALNLKMDRSSTDAIETLRVDPEGGDGNDNVYPYATEQAIEAILARPEYAGIRFYHSGDVPLNAVYGYVIADESALLNGITAAVIGAILLLSFRSIVGVLAPLIVVQLAVLFTVAMMAVIGWKLDISFSSAPTLLTAIGVAHSVHILSEFRTRFLALGDRREALVETIYLVGTPCLLTSLTTAAAFAAMSFVPIKTISHMGIYSAFGVIAAFVLSLTLLMSLLSFGRRHQAPRAVEAVASEGPLGAVLATITRFNVRHRTGILAAFALFFVTIGAGIPRLIVDSNWLDDFSDRMPLKGVVDHVDKVMGGSTNLIYLFDSGEPDGIKDPAVLREMERVQELALATDPGLVRKTFSIVDTLKELNQAFHEGDPAYQVIPESRELVAQYLLLYETSGGEDAEELVSSDYQRASLELRLANNPIGRTKSLTDVIAADLEARPLEASTLEITGIGSLWLKLLNHIVDSQIQGFLLAFGAITLMMIAIFRSISTGLIGMIPNLTPVIAALGGMGWFGVYLDYAKVSIAAVAMGIAVDDTIHMVTRFRHEFGRTRNYAEALRHTLMDVGRALTITSVALVCGFLVLTLSLFDSNALQGIILAMTIVVALIADFFLMPALVLTFHPFGPEGERSEAPSLLKEAA